jgi:hypothetical protein
MSDTDEVLNQLGNYANLKAWRDETGARVKTKTDYEKQFEEYLDTVKGSIKLFECPLGYAFVEIKYGIDGEYYFFHWVPYSAFHVMN